MKTVSKKLLSLLLVAFLLVSALPFQAFAAEVEGLDVPVVVEEVLAETEAPATEAPTVEIPVTEAPVTEAPVTEAPVTEAPVENITIPGETAEAGTGTGTGIHPETHEHQLNCVSVGGYQHKYVCIMPGCDYETAPENCRDYAYENETHRCKECNDTSRKDHWLMEIAAEIPATCTVDGKTKVEKCALCGLTFGGDVIPHPVSGHVDANGDGTCDVCGEILQGAMIPVTFVVGAGHQFTGLAADTQSITKNWEVGTAKYEFPSVVETPYAKFKGWFTTPEGGVQIDTTKLYDGVVRTLYAHWQDVTYPVSVYRIINKNVSTAKLLTTLNLTPDALLSKAVEDAGYLSYAEPGYKVPVGGGYEYPIMKYVGNTFVSLGSGDYANGGFNVYLNMVPYTYSLILNANGGIVTPAKITDVAYMSTITLPTPKKEGSVFMGWKDVNNVIHPAGNAVYDFQQDTTFTAVWDDELTVMLKVYINGDTTSAPRIYPLSQLVKDSKVYRADIEGIINRDYTSNGGTMVVYGLYSDKTWNNGVISVDGNPFVQVSKENGVNYIYVMLMNAALKNTIVTGPTAPGAYWVSNGNGTGYWVTPNFSTNTPYIYTNGLNGAYWVNTGNNSGYWVYPGNIIVNGSTNPKTGDTAMIEVAAAVMVLAAAALVVSLGLRKKKVQ